MSSLQDLSSAYTVAETASLVTLARVAHLSRRWPSAGLRTFFRLLGRRDSTGRLGRFVTENFSKLLREVGELKAHQADWVMKKITLLQPQITYHGQDQLQTLFRKASSQLLTLEAPPNTEQATRTQQAVEEAILEEGLNIWLQDEQAKGKKAEAARRIKRAYCSLCPLLSLDNLGLNKLPNELWSLTHLIDLRMRGNHLKTLPPELGKLKKLKLLDLSSNKLNFLPKEIGELHELRQLYLNRNQLSVLTQGISQLEKLEELYLYENGFRQIPQWINKLKNMDSMYISTKQASGLPDWQGSLIIVSKKRKDEEVFPIY